MKGLPLPIPKDHARNKEGERFDGCDAADSA